MRTGLSQRKHVPQLQGSRAMDRRTLARRECCIDGEIACVDELGRSVFNDLLFRRKECVFFAFDLLFLNGEDLRTLPLIERKARLKKLLRRKPSRVLYVDHIEA